MILSEPENLIARLESCLRGPKPGLAAQLRMVPDPRPGDQTYQDVGDSCLKAGVLVLLYTWKERVYLALTRRTSKVAHHQDQISFPGGQMDERESIVEAALREGREEVGIRPESLRILGELTPLYIPPSNYCIYPVVAFAKRRPDFRPFPDEVEEVIEVPLDHLLNPDNTHQETWPLRGVDVSVPFYQFGDHKIWGATAMVLAELIEMLQQRNSPYSP
jgi:8-oxo-dGTP pyrophosphatase MutT (NUDIX family)